MPLIIDGIFPVVVGLLGLLYVFDMIPNVIKSDSASVFLKKYRNLIILASIISILFGIFNVVGMQ